MNNSSVRTILIVEDEILFADFLSKKLSALGYETLIASSGEDAVEMISEISKIHLVLMDMDLGEGMDGAESAKKILLIRYLPIIFHSSHFEKEILERVKNITRYGYLMKNSGDFALNSAIEVALHLFESHQKNLENQLTEEANTEAANLFHSVVENIPNMIFIKHAKDLRFALLNRAGEKLLGINRNDLIGKNDYDFFPKEQAGFFTNKDREVLSQIEIVNIPEEEIQTPGGTRILHTKKLPLMDEMGNPQYLLGISEDITDKIEAEKKIREIESQFKNMFEKHNAVMLLIEPNTGLILDANKAAANFYGFSKAELTSTSLDKINTLNPEKIFKERQKAVNEKRNYFIFRHKIASGEERTVEVHSSPILFNGEIVLFSIIHDITNRRIAEDKIKALLSEKELLLKEVHHRIKNNMLTITSLLHLQTENLKDEAAISALNDASSRIQSMLVLYDKLYRSSDFRELSIQEYLATLVEEIVNNFPNNKLVKIEKSIDNFVLPTSIIFPVGIMINELLTNAMKYAFQGREAGLLKVIAAQEEDTFLFSIQDDGIGFPDNVTLKNSTGFGLQLVKMLTRQLKGSLEFENINGTKFTLKFKLL